MATFYAYTLKSGLASDPTVWFVALSTTPTVRAPGVVPQSSTDLYRVLICAGHTVELDGAYVWGNDAAGTVVINSVSTTAAIYHMGTLKASRSVSSSLTLRGSLFLHVLSALDFGTRESPIPENVTAQLLPNFSSAPANSKYNIGVASNSTCAGFRFFGAEKDAYANVTENTLSTDTIIPVSRNGGWKVDDLVTFGRNSYSDAARVVRKITSVGIGTITIDQSLGTASSIGRKIANLTRNVKLKLAVPYSGACGIQIMTISPTGFIELGNLEIGMNAANNASGGLGGLILTGDLVTVSMTKIKEMTNLVLNPVFSYSAGVGVFYPGVAALGYSATVGETGAVVNGLSGLCVAAVDLRSNAQLTINNVALIGASTINFFNTGGSGTPASILVNGGWIDGCNQLSTSLSSVLTFKGVELDGQAKLAVLAQMRGPLTFDQCAIGQRLGNGPDSQITFGENSSIPVIFSGCAMREAAISATTSLIDGAGAQASARVLSRNNDITLQERYTYGGKQERDNSVRYRGRSSMRFDCWYAANPLTYTFTIPAAAGATITLRGAMRYNADYGSDTPPRVTMSVQGAADQFVECPMTGSDTWFPYLVSITNSLSYATDVIVTYSAKALLNTASCWFDGIIDSPWVQWARHYGYIFDSNASSVVDPVTMLSLEAAEAITGVTLSGGTLTVTASRTIREIYDWVQWYECANLLNPVLKSTDGVNFTLLSNLTIDGGAITGSGAISMLAYTLTTINGGGSSLPISHIGGTSTALVVSGITPGSRLRIHDGAVEWCNEIVTDASFVQSRTWSSDKTLDVRLTYCDGATAKLPWQQTAIFGSGGVSLLANQLTDNVYSGNGVDGSAVTEFMSDYTNVQVDVNDADGVTTAQRLYAWMTYNSTLPAGIAAYFEAVQADDDVNYRITVALLDLHIQNVGSNAVIIAGARLYRDNGTSIFSPGNGPIQLEPGKAYVAGASGIAAEVAAALAVPTAAQNATAVWTSATRTLTSGGSSGGATSAEVAEAVVNALVIPTVAEIATGLSIPTSSQNAEATALLIDVPTVAEISSSILFPTASENAIATSQLLDIPTVSEIADAIVIPTSSENASAVWNSQQDQFMQTGTFGRFVSLLLSVSKFLGLK